MNISDGDTIARIYSSKSDEWGTPVEILKPVHTALGGGKFPRPIVLGGLPAGTRRQRVGWPLFLVDSWIRTRMRAAYGDNVPSDDRWRIAAWPGPADEPAANVPERK